MKQRLLEEADALPAVSLAAAMAYQDKLEKLRTQVDRQLTGHPDILSLIGFSPLEMMYANHRHHGQFMATVFRLNAYKLLPKIVTWVYRAYRKHGFANDYFPLELRAWQAAVRDNLEPAPAEEILRIYQWLLNRHGEFCALADSGEYATFSVGFDAQESMRILLAHMLNNDYRACLDFAVESVHSPEELACFYEEVMTPSLYEIGRLWEEGEISTVQEHLATAISMRILSVMFGSFVTGHASKGRAVISAAPNEFHEVGARMVADQLEMDGWRVDYLGANSPAADLIDLLRRDPPFLLGFSVVVPFNIEEIRRIIAAIRADEAFNGVRIMVGGPVFTMEPELCRRIGADGFAASGRQAVELARQWWEDSTQ